MAHREERGQALALMLVTIGLTLVGGVLVIDIGLLFDERRQVQAAADFAALAAAQDLPRNPADPDVVTKLSTAETTAHSYLEWNGYDEAEPDVSHVVTTTYTGEVDKIEVVVRSSRSWLFGGLFGWVTSPSKAGPWQPRMRCSVTLLSRSTAPARCASTATAR